MKLSVYYDEIDGELNPTWILLPAKTSEEYENYSIEAPFERFYPEDFHDCLNIVTVTQGAMTKCPFIDMQFDIHIPTVKQDLLAQGKHGDSIYEADYFLVRMDDLEEVLQMEVRNKFNWR